VTAPLVRVGAQTGALTNNKNISIFDTTRGQQQCTFRFELREAASDRLVRVLTPYADTVPVLLHDTTRTIKRSLSLHLDPADTAAVDVIAHRVVPSLVDYTGALWSLGRYMFSDYSRIQTTGGDIASPMLMDESFIIDQSRETAFPVTTLPGSSSSVMDLIDQLMTGYPTVGFVAEPSPYATPNTWSYGTSNFQILSDLATQGAYFAPWMANDTLLHFIRSFDPGAAIPDIDWDRYPHVLADSVTATDDLLTAPNRFVVVSNNPASTNEFAQPIVGSYDIPVNAPNSISKRGFVLPDIRQLQLTDPTQAQAVAEAIGIASTVFERVSLTTFPDPRHDSYNVIRWQEENWLELSWSMNMIAGGAMSHTLRKAYP
jgi:hypothetical protein